jgi:hypothetical protein
VLPTRESELRAQLVVAAMEGALILARVLSLAQTILDVAKLTWRRARRSAMPRSAAPNGLRRGVWTGTSMRR